MYSFSSHEATDIATTSNISGPTTTPSNRLKPTKTTFTLKESNMYKHLQIRDSSPFRRKQ